MTPEQQQERQQAQVEAQDLQRVIGIGMDVQVFMEGAAGRYIRARANTQMQEAMEALASANPFDNREIQQHQQKYQVASLVLSWIGDIVTEGENAARQFAELQHIPD